MVRKKERRLQQGQTLKSASQLEKDRSNLLKLTVLPIVLVLVITVAFPEVSEFAINSLRGITFGRTVRHSTANGTANIDVEDRGAASSTDDGLSKEVNGIPQKLPDLPQEVRDFKPTYQKTLTTKKIFLEGRRIAPVELLPQRNVSSNHSVRVFLFDDFLSVEECDGLRVAHDKHVKHWSGHPPILCFESLDTLRKNLRNVKKSHLRVDDTVFTDGTYCLNASFSQEVAGWMQSNWSYSTAFYPGESPFSKKMSALIHETTGLNKKNGGKFQITSYPLNIGYKKHTDCTEKNPDRRDRMATVLVYLDDVESGGETSFPELGIWVKPRKGRALVWNNMNEKGDCDPISIHQANKVIKGHKYIIQRWYYYESFWSLGQRPQPPALPQRPEGQAMVSCDEYKHGSCRWYDEWSYDVMKDYRETTTLI